MTFGSGVFGSGLFGGAMSSGLSGVTYTIEMAFGDSYSTPATSRTWTDVTAYVSEGEPAVIGFARGDEFSTADANSLALTLNNTDGRFTPGNTSGAYYPDVKVGVPVRVTATVDGSASVRFVGYVDEWPLEWPGGSQDYALVRVASRSRMARLGVSAALGNVIHSEVMRDGPAAYYMLDNLSDSVAGGSALARRGSGTAVTFTGTGPGTDGIQAAVFAGGQRLRAPDAVPGGAAEIWFVTSTADRDILTESTGAALVVSSTGKIGQRVAGITTDFGSSPVVTDGLLHHLVWLDAAGTAYIDGVSIGSLTANIGPLPIVGSGFVGTLAHLAYYAVGSEPTATRISDHHTAGRTGFEDETAGDRLTRYAAYAGIPAAEVTVNGDAGTPMAHIDTTGQTPLDLMRKLEQADGGVIYDARDGTLAIAGRALRYNAAPAMTLQAHQVETGVIPKLDRSALVNDVKATVVDGSDPQETVTARDEASYDEYGPHHHDLELATTDPDEAHAAAWWRVNTYSEPRPRIPALRAALETLDSADVSTLLGLTVGSKIEVENWPSQVGTAYADGFFVEGYTETIGVGFHHIEFNVSPATGFDVWTVEDDPQGTIGDDAAAVYALAY